MSTKQSDRFKSVGFIDPANEEKGINAGREFIETDALFANDLNKVVKNIIHLEEDKSDVRHKHDTSEIITGILPVEQGGTGLNSIDSFSREGHTHSPAELATGLLRPENGGTGQGSLQATRNAMGLGNTLNALPIANGGTGATTAAAARDSLGLGNTAGALPVANGGTGTTTHVAGRVLIAQGQNAFTTGGGTVGGNLTVNGTINATSDKRKKKNILNIEFNVSDKLLTLPIKTFEYKEEIKGVHVGLIAQEVQNALGENSWMLIDDSDKNSLSVKETKLTYLLLDLVQKQEKRIKELEKKIGGK